MAFEGNLQALPGLSASADLSAKQFRFVKASGNATVDVCAAITDKLIGVLQDNPTSGQPANVVGFGVSKVVAGGNVTAGDVVGTDNQGRAVTIVPGSDTTQYIGGRAITGGAIGEDISISVTPGGRAA
jgi:hypothetical protein